MAISILQKEILRTSAIAIYLPGKNQPLIWYWTWLFKQSITQMLFTVLMNPKPICIQNYKEGYCVSCICLFLVNLSFGSQRIQLVCFRRLKKSKRSIQGRLSFWTLAEEILTQTKLFVLPKLGKRSWISFTNLLSETLQSWCYLR